MSGQSLTPSGPYEVRAIQRRHFDLAIRSPNAEFVTDDSRMPTDIDDSAHAILVLDHHRCIVFDRVMVHNVRPLTCDLDRLSEQEIQNVDAVGSDIEQRTASGSRRIDQPAATARSVEPHMIREFRDNRLADRALLQQLLCALHLGIAAPVVRDSEQLAALFRNLNHGAGLGLIHRHWLLADDMLSGAQGLHRLRRVQKDWCSHIHGLDCRIGERLIQSSPGAHAVTGGLRGIARDHAVQSAARFGLNRRNDATNGDVPNSDDNPVEHGSLHKQKLKAGGSRPSNIKEIRNYFLGAIASFAALATRNFTTVFALIWMGSPV